jgi:tetratricopeptide (TPR) repeat protein
MTSRLRLLLAGLVVLGLWSAGVYLLFQHIYAPNILLYKIWSERIPATDAAVDSLKELALKGHFGMTDSLRIITLSEYQNDPDTALEIYAGLVERFPKDDDLRLWYADFLSKHHHYEQADAVYSALIQLDQWPTKRRDALKAAARNAVAAATVAKDPEEQQQWLKTSAEFYMTCINEFPEALDARGEYANILLKLNQPEQSLQQYEDLLEIKPDNVGWLSSGVIAAAAAGDFRKAEHYIFVLAAKTDAPDIPLRLARVYYWAGKYDESIEQYDKLATADPDDLALRRERLDVLFAGRKTDRFMMESARYLAIEPQDRDVWKMRINMAMEMENLDLAEREASSLLAMFPDDQDARLNKAMLNLWLRRYQRARTELQAILAANPENQTARKHLAQAYLWDRQPEEALKQFRLMGQAVLDDHEAAQGYAEALEAAGTMTPDDMQFAAQAVERVLQSGESPFNWATATALARAMKKMREYPTARELFQTAVELRPQDVGLKIEYADLLQDMGLYEQADQMYRAVME